MNVAHRMAVTHAQVENVFFFLRFFAGGGGGGRVPYCSPLCSLCGFAISAVSSCSVQRSRSTVRA